MNSNGPIETHHIVPLDVLVGTEVRKNKRISSKKVEELALERFKHKEGITYRDLRDSFGISKKSAQRKLKECVNRKLLFAPGTHKPQRYYPSVLRAEVVEDLDKKHRNVLVQPTGVSPSSRHPLSNIIENQKARSFFEVLCSLGRSPLFCHKLQLHTQIGMSEYIQLQKQFNAKNKSKIYEEHIGQSLVRYIYSPNGRVEVSVACNRYPFKIETEDDLLNIFTFFGQVRDRMMYLLSDPRGRIVPPVSQWILKQCDINKDVDISDLEQITLPDIQLKAAGRVFRMYVKLMQDKAVYRGEESTTINLPIVEGLNAIRLPISRLEHLIDKLDEQANKNLEVGGED